ncbi:hypothetical protein CBOM_04528 [Ceraceosorus bombacis]|uniref:Uncharacterized protein n=1 Tax=Ceraceosorus bombacis TaxID=401625 RepID=A0A0P1BNY6_9BASI|nr:hypothetical protein CBOM_04528 [Ceraceosorus bombacis]
MSSHHQHLPAGGISASSVSGWPSAHAGVESSHQQSNTSRVDVGSSDAGSNLAAWERPRVRAEGPGGPEVKQGARIAECVFEKHRRGRKPGRWNGAGAPASGHSHEAHYSGSASTSSSPVEFRRPRSEHHSEPSVMVPAPVSQHFPTHHPGMDTVSSFGRPASQWSSNAPRNSNEYGRSQVAQVIPDVHNSHRTAHGTRSDGHAPHASEPFSMGSAMHDSGAAGRSSVGTPASTSSYSPMIPNVRSASASATSQSSLRSAAWPGPISMPPPVRLHSANTLEHHTPGTASIPRSWNDFASPSRSLLSPGMSLAYGTPGSATGNVHPGSHLNTSAPYPAAQPMVGTPKRKADEDAHSYVGDSHRFSNEDAKRPRASDPAVQSEPSRSIPMETNSAASTSEEDDADEIDQLDEDALGEGADNEDVLQIPLRLLAHASEGMAATKAGEQKQSTGAATIGLHLDQASSDDRGAILPSRPQACKLVSSKRL